MLTTLLSLNFLQKCWIWINEWDTILFLQINKKWTSSWLDIIFPWWREANTWVPFYLFLIVFGIMNFRKQFLSWLLFVIVTFTISDQFSSTLIKKWVARPRPCNDAFLTNKVRLLLENCGSGFSFTSSHATNHFALAMFLFITLHPFFKKWGYLFFVWAATIAYAQVYVGVHYPLDVICGGLLGSGIGFIIGHFFRKKNGELNDG